MNRLVLKFYREASAPRYLTRAPLDDGSLILLYGDNPTPRWVAKIARCRVGHERLRREAHALAELEGWSTQLRIPRLLGWQSAEDSDGETECCLISSGVAGRPPLRQGRRDPSWQLRRLPRSVKAAIEWLRYFQKLVPPPVQVSPAALVARLRDRWDAVIREDRELAQAAPEMMPSISSLSPTWAPVAVHGDYWLGNTLIDRTERGVGVVDWNGFDSGTALEDLCCLIGTWARHARRRHTDDWGDIFFVSGEGRDFLRRWALDIGYSRETARMSFYLHIIQRILWELGCGNQTRNAAERNLARADWIPFLRWLHAKGYPDPFSPNVAVAV